MGAPPKEIGLSKNPDFKTFVNQCIDKNLAGRGRNHAVWRLCRVLRAPGAGAFDDTPSSSRSSTVLRNWVVVDGSDQGLQGACSVARARRRKTGRIVAENVGAVVNPVDGLTYATTTAVASWPTADTYSTHGSKLPGQHSRSTCCPPS